MKKTINVEQFTIKEIRLVQNREKQEDGSFQDGWLALIQYQAEDADGKCYYTNVARLALANNLVNGLVNSLQTAIDQLETNPPNPNQ